jgi:XTP/dITP diphosphohydrolase
VTPGPTGRGRLVLLSTSPRVAPGLLSWAAWDVVRSGRVLAADGGHPLSPYVDAAGAAVEVLAAADPADLARRLLDAAGGDPDRPVVFLLDPSGDEQFTRALSGLLVSGATAGGGLPEVEVLPGSYDLPGARLLDLVATMHRLRSPGGCPWDAEQTHESLVTYLVEETYETLEAIETGDRDHLREELGDLLLQVVFHARIAGEHPDDPWSVDDVAADIVAKLVRRHPHVFAGGSASTAAAVKAGWEAGKATEKGRTSSVEGVPMALPALALAGKLLHRVEQAGVVTAHEPGDSLGGALFRLVDEARAAGLDPETELRAEIRRYVAAVQAAEAAARGAATGVGPAG